MGPLTVHAAVFHEAAGIAVLELGGNAPVLAAVSAGFYAIVHVGSVVHRGIGLIFDFDFDWVLLCFESPF